MKTNEKPSENRRTWKRMTLPPPMFDLLIQLALGQGYREETLYVMLFRLLVRQERARIELLLQAGQLEGELPPELKALLDDTTL